MRSNWVNYIHWHPSFAAKISWWCWWNDFVMWKPRNDSYLPHLAWLCASNLHRVGKFLLFTADWLNFPNHPLTSPHSFTHTCNLWSDGKLCQKLFTVIGNIRDDEGRKLIFHNFSIFSFSTSSCSFLWKLGVN